MSEEKKQALVPVEEKTVHFYGDEITAALVETSGKSEVYVPLRPIAEYLGLDWSAQSRRLKRDEVLANEVISVAIMATEIGKGKGRRDTLCLPLEYLPGWLFGLEANRVKPELKEKIMRYRRECYRVLWRAFQDEALPFAEEGVTLTPTPRQPNPILVQIREQALAQAKMSEALAKMAEQQLEIEAKAMDAQDQAQR